MLCFFIFLHCKEPLRMGYFECNEIGQENKKTLNSMRIYWRSYKMHSKQLSSCFVSFLFVLFTQMGFQFNSLNKYDLIECTLHSPFDPMTLFNLQFFAIMKMKSIFHSECNPIRDKNSSSLV